MILDPILVNKILGLNLSSSEICKSLKKARLDAIIKNKKIACTIPPFRFDIFGPMDLVEEVSLGFGIDNLEATLPPSISVGEKSHITKNMDRKSHVMVGLGFTEVLNSSLVSKSIQYDLTNRNSSSMIEIVGSKSQEHTILRDSILPKLMENLSRNIHESYPQKLFETGVIFPHGNILEEQFNLGCIDAHKDTNFSEIKSILQSALKTGFNIKCETKTSSNPMFSNGRVADVIVENRVIGTIGEIDSKVIENFKIRVPVSAFEIKLTGLIFDNVLV